VIHLRQRNTFFYADWRSPKARIRAALGTQNRAAALNLLHRLEMAIAQGPTSSLWPQLKLVLPSPTFTKFANVVGFTEIEPIDWTVLRDGFLVHLKQRVSLGKLAESTKERYELTVREFEVFLVYRGIQKLQDITKQLVEEYKLWRIERMKSWKNSRGGRGISLEAAVLHRIFSFAIENELLTKNPVRFEGKPGHNPSRGAQPFTGAELAALRENAGEDLLAYLLLRWTGLRGGDACQLTWKEVHFDQGEIERITEKRKKKVIIPIHPELQDCLFQAYLERLPDPKSTVLLNPANGVSMTRPRLYARIQRIGQKANVERAHPHRFRDTLAVDMLIRGASPYDVAKILGDTIQVVEDHYTPFVRELRERVRLLISNPDLGIEAPTRKQAAD